MRLQDGTQEDATQKENAERHRTRQATFTGCDWDDTTFYRHTTEQNGSEQDRTTCNSVISTGANELQTYHYSTHRNVTEQYITEQNRSDL